MPTIGVLTRSRYGKRLLDTLAAHTNFEITSVDIPPTLPYLIDEPAPRRVLYLRPRPHGPEPGDNPYPVIQGERMLLPGSG